MKEEGPRLGYQKYADAITKNSSGDFVVRDKKLRGEILKLREDPQVALERHREAGAHAGGGRVAQ